MSKRDLKLLYDNMKITGFQYRANLSILDQIDILKKQIKNNMALYEQDLKELKENKDEA